jgi:alpha-tubulin suppressor-like RCC1 family protein
MKLLLIDSRVTYGPLISARTSNVDYVIFDYASSLDKVISAIYDKGVIYTDIALVQHGSGTLYSIVEGVAASITDEGFESFGWLEDFLMELHDRGLRNFDILACDLYSMGNVAAAFTYLETVTGVHIRASTNATGNPRCGGDWIMESDGTDIRDIYFTAAIEEFNELLYPAWWGNNQYGIDNRIASTVQAVGGISGGRVYTWGAATSGAAGYNSFFADIPSGIEYTDISALYTTTAAIAAIDNSGFVWAWGNNNSGGLGGSVTTAKRSNIVTNGNVIAAENAFAVIDSSGRMWSWGNTSFGGTGASASDISSPAGLTGITFFQNRLCAAGYAFAAIDASFLIRAWGSSTQGGASTDSRTAAIPSGLTARFFDGPIRSNKFAFAAVDSANRVWAWGSTTQGGGSPTLPRTAVTPTGMTSILCNRLTIQATNTAFAVLSTTNRVWAWGEVGAGGAGANATTGAIPTNLAAISINALYSTSTAFAALDTSGRIWCWGNAAQGGVSAATSATTPTGLTAIVIQSGKVASNDQAFAALDTSSRVWCWGASAYGGSSVNAATAYTPTNLSGIVVSQLYSNNVSFAALDTSGRVWCWGGAALGAVDPVPQTAVTPFNLTNVVITKIYSGTSTYIAVDQSNNTWSWGSINSGGTGDIVRQVPFNSTLTRGANNVANVNNLYTSFFDNSNDIVVWGASTNITSNAYTVANTATFPFDSVYDTSSVYPNVLYSAGMQRINKKYRSSVVFSLLDKSQRLWTWGLLGAGAIGSSGRVANLFENITVDPTKIYSNERAVAVIDVSQRFYVVGTLSYGGVSTTAPVTNAGFTTYKMQEILPSARAFSVLDSSGRIWAWGDIAYGGVASTSTLTTPTGLAAIVFQPNRIYSTDAAFAAIDPSGRVWCWGSVSQGGISNATATTPTNLTTRVVTYIHNTLNAFAALDSSGRVWCWGTTTDGGVSSTSIAATPSGLESLPIQSTKLFANNYAFAAIDASDRVWCWGSTVDGGISNTVASTPTGLATIRIQNVYSTASAFAALDFSGRVWAWGATTAGGINATTATTPSGIEAVVFGINDIYPISAGFATLDSNKRLRLWGSTTLGGISTTTATVPTNLSGVRINKINYTNGGVFAIAESGIVYSWGSTLDGHVAASSATRPTNLSNEIVELYPNNGTMTLLDIYNNVWGIGSPSIGRAPNTSTASNPIAFYRRTPIYSTVANQASIAYIDASRNVYTLGDASNGSLIYGYPHMIDLRDISAIKATDFAFAAIDASGFVRTWGNSRYGGIFDTSSTRVHRITSFSGTKGIFATRTIFCAIDSANLFWRWGTNSLDNSLQALTRISPTLQCSTVIPNSYAFAVIDISSRLWVLGETTHGALDYGSLIQIPATSALSITSVTSTIGAFAALDTTGRVWAWGISGFGGSLPSGISAETPPNLVGVTISGQIYATQSAFAAMDTQGRVWSWGNTGEGGCGANAWTAARVPNLSGVQVDWSRVYSTATAFAVIDASEQIWTWGSLTGGGCGAVATMADIPSNLRGVRIKDVKSTLVGFGVTDMSDTFYLIGSEYVPNKVHRRAYTPPELFGQPVQSVFGSAAEDFIRNQNNVTFVVSDVSNNVYIYSADNTSQAIYKRGTVADIVPGFSENRAPAIPASQIYNVSAGAYFVVQNLITTIGTDFSDTNIGDIKSVVVIGQDTTNGVWKYSADDVTYYEFSTALSATAGVLMTPTTYLKFFPTVTTFTGTTTLTMKAYDSTPMYYDGSLNELGDAVTTSYLTTGAFSTDSFTASMLYTQVNTPPSLTNGSYTLYTTYEDVTDVSNTGVLIGSFITSLGGAYSDIDPGASRGIAITAIEFDFGTWKYRLSGDVSFQDISTATSSTNSLLLNESATILFAPNPNQFNSFPIIFKAWDQTTGTAGQYVNSAYTATGAFSSGTAFGLVNVLPINDPPVLVSGVYPFFSISEDIVDASNTGRTVGQLLDIISGNYTDVDSALRGIAIIGAVTTNGTWGYRLDGSASFTTIGAVSEVSGLLLDPSATVRFVPAAHYNGTALMTFKAWDQTVGSAGQLRDTTYTASGGAFSLASAQAQATIEAVNDPPIITAGTSITLQTIPYNISDVSNTGITVQQIITQLGPNYTDVDVDASRGIGIIGYLGAANLEYNVSGVWIVAPPLSTVSGLLLDLSSSIRARSMTAAGQFALTAVGWDQTAGTAGQLRNTAYTATGAFSLNTLSGDIILQSTAPAAPTITDISTQADGVVRISWTPSSTGGVPLAYYDISTTPFIDITTVSGDVSSAVIVGLNPSTVYTASITVYNTSGLSASAFSSSFKPNIAPTLVAGTYSIGSILEDVSDASNVGITVSSILLDVSCSADSSGVVLVSVNNISGVWEYNVGGGFTVVPADISDASGLLLDSAALVRFVPAANFFGTAALQLKVWDATAGSSGQIVNTLYTASGPYSAATATAVLSILAVNDSPQILNNPAITINTRAFGVVDSGTVVGDIITGLGANYFDVDPSASKNIAVYEYAHFGASQLQYNLGAGWVDVSAGISRTNALLLSAAASIRVTGEVAAGTYDFNAVAWDATVGSEGQYVDASYIPNGPFSFAHFTAATIVTAVAPDAAAITAVTVPAEGTATVFWTGPAATGGSPINRYILETVPASSVYTLDPSAVNHTITGLNLSITYAAKLTVVTDADLSAVTISGSFRANFAPILTAGTYSLDAVPVTDASNAGTTITSFLQTVGANTDGSGIAIVGATGWEYALSGGSYATISGVSAGAALLLNGGARIRYSPLAVGIYTFNFKAWDQTEGTVGGYYDTSYSSVGAFSLVTASGEITVFAVNTAPTLTAAIYSLGSIPEDISSALNVGRTIGQLLLTISENYVDSIGDERGLAIVGADNTNGQWEYRLAAGSFTTLSGLSAGAALLLDASATLRFVPAANYNGTAQLSIKAWDRTVGAVGDIVDTSYTSAGAFSENTGFAEITVESVNDPPVLIAGTYSLGGMVEDLVDASNVGISVQVLLTAIGANYIDVDTAAKGIAIVGTDQSYGIWEYRLFSGFFAAVEPVGATGLLLDASAVVRFVPAANYNGFTTFQFVAWDQTVGFAGTKISTAYTVSGAFSDVSATASLYVSPANDSPQINNSPMIALETVSFTITDASNVGVTIQSIIDSLNTNYVDIDVGAERGIGIIGYTGIGGALQYSISGDGTWITAGGLSRAAALLLQPQSRIRVRSMTSAGQFTVTGIAWDRTGGAAGSIVDASYIEGGPYSFGTFMGIITVSAVVPDAATITSVTAVGDGFESIAWTAPTNTGGAAIARYEIITTPYTVRTIVPAVATSATINNMSPLQTYTATVITVNAAELSAASLPSAVFRPNLPPVLTASTYSIGTILEDVSDASNVGITMQSILLDLSCSVDSSSIVIVGLSNENGTWEYNVGGGFIAVPTVADPSGFLLSRDALLRFVPDFNYVGDAAITLRVWDGTDGSVNTVVNTAYTTNGPYSLDSAVALITVFEQNDAPEILNNPVISLGDIPYLNMAGIGVSSLIDLLGPNYIDNDVDASRNIAVYSYTGFGSSVIQYSPDNGATYYDISSAITRQNALLLDGAVNTASLRWTNLSVLGPYTMNALAWDGSVGTVYTYDDATYIINGAFSSAHFSIELNVIPIEPQPPVITDISVVADGFATFTWTAPTNTGGSPIKRYEIVTVPASSTFTINPVETSYTLFGLDPTVEYYALFTVITEVDLSSTVSSALFRPNVAPTLLTGVYSVGSIPKDISAGANIGTTVAAFIGGIGAATNATGIAIVGVNNTNGTWEYSVSGGFTGIVGISVGAGLLLDGSAVIRFVPNLGYTGTATFTFKGWDQTAGVAGTLYDTAYSYSGAFSQNSGTGQITVLPTNTSPGIINNPVITVESVFVDIPEAANGGVLVQSIITALGSNYVETDPGALQGIAIIGLSADNSGILQYNIGAGWLSIAPVSLTSALPLAPASSIRILPTGAGSGSFVALAWDQTAGSAGVSVNATYVPGGPYSFNGFRGIFNISAGSVVLIVEPVSFSNEKSEVQLTEDRVNRLLAVEAGVRLSEIPPNRQLYNSSDRLRVYLGRIRLAALA